jgi:GGDEF domain-containing protein
MVTQPEALFGEQAQRTESLRREAYHDSLTGLNNRRAFDMQLQSRLSDEENDAGHLICCGFRILSALISVLAARKPISC